MLSKLLLGKSVLFWLVLLGIVLLCLALAVAVFLLIRRRRRRRAAQGLASSSGAREVGPDLRAIRRAFEAQLPDDHRRALPLFTPFVVLGEPQSGKSTLIDQHTDWRGQAAQFHPSHTDDPLLQIYQGLGAVVYELSPVLLQDPSNRVREALLKLWRPLRRGKPPRAVVVLNATSLAGVQPDDLVKHAQAIRGKINVLSRAARKPIQTSLVLTHLDQVEGFLELSGVMREHGRAMAVEFPEGEIPPAAGWLDEVEDYLPAVLAGRPAPEYLKALRFLGAMGGLTSRAESFARALTAPDPLAVAPIITGVALTSTQEPAGGPFEPFAVTITPQDARAFHPHRRHQLAAVAAAGVLGAWVVAGYLHDRGTIGRAQDRVDAYLQAPQDSFARNELFDQLKAERSSLSRRLLPGFFPEDDLFTEPSVRLRFLAGLRLRVFLPKLAEFERAHDGLGALYVLSLLEASEENALGRYILEHSREWEDALRLPRTMVADQVSANSSPTRLPLPMDDRTFRERFKVPINAELPSASTLLDALEKVPQTPQLTRAQLSNLKRTADGLLTELDALERTARFANLCDLLNRQTKLSFGAAGLDHLPRLPEVDQESLVEVAALLRSSELTIPDPQKLTLAQVLIPLERLAAQKPGPGRQLRLKAGERQVVLSTQEWEKLLIRSRASLLLREFAAARQGDYRGLLFSRSASYQGVDINAGGEGGGVIVGRARVDGIFTEKAYTAAVKPVLTRLPQVLKALPVSDEDRTGFSEFVSAEVEDYATRYIGSWHAFFKGYSYQVDSVAQLTYLLTLLQSPASPQRRLLAEMVRHTSIEPVEGNPFFEPLAQVTASFNFARAIVPKPGGPTPALDKYVAILGQLQTDLDDQSAAADEDGLASRLAPIGRVALAIFREQPDSYYNRVEKWLATVNARADEREPFTGPITRAYRLGVREVERGVAESWGGLRANYVLPLAAGYPFRREAESTASPAVIEAALAPGKDFWSGFENQLGPVCSKSRGTWQARRSRHGKIGLPPGMLSTVNRLAELSTRLFDAKGAPRALLVALRPLALPSMRADHHVVVVAYLQSGESTVFGFNQRPDWSEVKLEWWKATAASVGAAFTPEGGNSKVYRSVSIAETEWSLLRLLRLARVDEHEHIYSWNVDSPAGGGPLTIRFQLRADPFASLRVRP